MDLKDLEEAFSGEHTRTATIQLADGRVVNVPGTMSRDAMDRGTGRAGTLSARTTFSFPSHLCEDVAEGDAVRLIDVDYLVKGPPSYGGPLTTLTLRRSS